MKSDDFLDAPDGGADSVAKASTADAFLNEGRSPTDTAVDAIKSIFRDILMGVRGPRSVMEEYAHEDATSAAARPAPVAPLREETYRVLEATLRQMNPEQRARMATAPGVYGRATQKILADMGERATRLPTAVERLDMPRPPAELKASDYEGFGNQGPTRYWSDYSAGVVGSTGATLSYAGRKLGIAPLQDLGESMVNYSERITPSRQTFGDRVVGAVGSMASFYVPGLGVAKGADALAMLSPALAKWTGAGVMAGLEAAGEANDVYQTSVRSGIAPQEAAARADQAFIANLALLGVTDKLAFFNDVRGLGKRIGTAALVEGPGQEAPQQIIANYLTDQPLGEGVPEAAAIGALVGGGARGVQTATEGVSAAREARQDVPDTRTAASMPATAPATTVGAPTARPAMSAAEFLDEGQTVQQAAPTPARSMSAVDFLNEPVDAVTAPAESATSGMLAEGDGDALMARVAGARDAPSASGEQNRFVGQLEETGEPASTARGDGGDIASADILAQRTEPSPDEESDTALPATRVVMTPAYTAAGGEVNDAAQARPDAIRQAIRRVFNVPINEGRFRKSRDTLGIYRIKPQTIRVRNQNDVGVITHETGHHFSETSQPVRDLMKAHQGELRQITPYAAGQKTAALQREEGFAEYLRMLWTRPAEAKARAPGFHSAFAKYVDDHGYRKAFTAIEGAIRDWENLPPAQRILAKVGRIAERPTAADIGNSFIFEVLDRWHPLKRMVADLKSDIAPSKDPFKAAHLLAGDAAVIEDWVTSHTIPFDPARRADPKNYGAGLRQILTPVGKRMDEFKAYAIARRASELLKSGREHLFTKEEIDAGMKLETPEFKKAADELIAYNDRLIDYAEEGGLLSSSIADRLRKTGAYTVPFFRESEDGGRHAGGKNPFKRIFGGTENLRDPTANLVQNTANIVYATNRNAVLAKAYQLAKEVPGGGRWIEEVPIPEKALHVPTKSILEAFERQGVSIDQQTAAALAQVQKLIVPNPLDDTSERIVIVRINGTPKALQINNKLLAKVLQSFEPIDLGIVEKLLSVPSDLLRAGVTLSPEFMARNFMRDTLSGFIQSKAGILPVVGTAAGFKEVATRSDVAKLYRSFGAAYADIWKGESTQTAKILERMAKRGKFDPRTILTPGGIIRALHALGSISEAGTRVGEFKKTAKPGDVDSLIEAAYNAREVSVDFGMHGANPTVRLLTRITPFLNPAMQGLYKMTRSGRERFAVTLFRGAFLTAFSVALYLLNRGADWYDELEQWERNVYWHFDVGLRNDGQVIPLRVPKPFEWGAVFGSFPEALTQYAIERRGRDFWKRLASIWNDVFALRAVPTAALVPAEVWANKNTFTDRPIVPESKAGLDPELQHGNYTSLTAREIGNVTGTSPAVIDHLMRGFFGTLGTYAVILADIVARQAGDYPSLPEKTWRQFPLVKAFVHDPDNPNARYLTDFYELLKDARRREATLRRGYEGEAADAYFEKHRAVIETAADANRTAREVAGIRKENDTIVASSDYTGEEKRALINANNREIKRTAKDFMLDAIRQGIR